jgi:hypothetical protein
MRFVTSTGTWHPVSEVVEPTTVRVRDDLAAVYHQLGTAS